MARGGGIAGRLYRGDVSINFVGRQRLWYAISGLILLISVVALLIRGLNFSLEFKGGSSFTFPPPPRPARARSPGWSPVRAAATPPCRTPPRSSTHQWTVQTGTLTSHATQKVATRP